MRNIVPPPILHSIERKLALRVNNFSFTGGGCINKGGRLATSKGDFFLKWNDAHKYPAMFLTEARGLQLLQKPACITVPNVILTGVEDEFQFIVLEFIESATQQSNYWQKLGEQLALIHSFRSTSFGLDHNNYIGSLPQRNTQMTNWIDFFIEQRLSVQLDLALRNDLVDNTIADRFQRLWSLLPSLLAVEEPSLLHGDLWSGNLITDRDGNPCVIDPAVYFGHREADLAFTCLFGGFDTTFYDSYMSALPLEKDYNDRFDLYNLYPLLVHVNLFGRSYLGQVVSILSRFV